jgi:hypothetical protein
MPRPAPHGFQRIPHTITIPASALVGTSAMPIVTSHTFGFRWRLEKAFYVSRVAHTGASGSRVVNIKRGTTSLATITATTATHGTVGVVTEATYAVAGDAREFGDADALTVAIDAGGTTITAGAADLVLVMREIGQAA